MIDDNKDELRKIKEEFNKKIDFAISQIENTKALEILKDDTIEKLDEIITPFYETAKKVKKVLRKFNFFIDVFSEIGKLAQFKAKLDAKNKEKPDMTI